MRTHFIIRYVCISLALLSILIIFLINKEEVDLDCFSIHSNDSDIYVDWNSNALKITDKIIINVSDNESFHKEYEVPALAGGFHFREGTHGNIYHINIFTQSLNGKKTDIGDIDREFLIYNQLPNLPLLTISTYGGADPSYKLAEKPDDNLWGASMVDNEYVSGGLKYQCYGQKDISTEIKIRCRGNTSSIESEKMSYKIHLADSFDLVHRHSEKYDDWVLLNSGTKLNFFVGNLLGRLCGMEWCLTGEFVNVILNGDWKGTYYLTPLVGIESSNGLVDKDGFIIENDAYWWKEGEVYFKTEKQVPQLGFTFIYPKLKSESDKSFIAIKEYMQQIENAIENNEYQEMIDENSFAKWILARDLCGVGDGGGSNQYYYLRSMRNSSNKLKMGPLWDWDSTFFANKWSKCRSSEVSYFGYLFRNDTFNEMYKNAYSQISHSLIDNLRDEFELLNSNYGNEIDKSWKLDAARWQHSYVTLAEKEDEWLRWFDSRISWMDRYVYDDFSDPSVEIDVSCFSFENAELDFVIDKEAYIDGWIDLYGLYTDEKGLKNNNCSIGYITPDGKVYLANELEDEPDLKNRYDSYYSQTAFDVLTKSYGQMCLVDLESDIIYREELDHISISENDYIYQDIEEYHSRIESEKFVNGVLTISGYLCSNEFDSDDEGMLLGYDVGGTVYTAEPTERTYIKNKYKCNSLKTGFNIKCNGKGKICAIDTINRLIYEDIE